VLIITLFIEEIPSHDKAIQYSKKKEKNKIYSSQVKYR